MQSYRLQAAFDKFASVKTGMRGILEILPVQKEDFLFLFLLQRGKLIFWKGERGCNRIGCKLHSIDSRLEGG